MGRTCGPALYSWAGRKDELVSMGWHICDSSVSMGLKLWACSGSMGQNMWARSISMDRTSVLGWNTCATSVSMNRTCGPALYPWMEHVGQLCIHGQNMWVSFVSMGWNMWTSSIFTGRTCGPALGRICWLALYPRVESWGPALYPWTEHVGQLCIHGWNM